MLNAITVYSAAVKFGEFRPPSCGPAVGVGEIDYTFEIVTIHAYRKTGLLEVEWQQ